MNKNKQTNKQTFTSNKKGDFKSIRRCRKQKSLQKNSFVSYFLRPQIPALLQSSGEPSDFFYFSIDCKSLV